MEEVVIPEGIKQIHNNTFIGCKSLESVKVPSTVTFIAYNSFGDNKTVVLYGKKGSHIETFAKENGYTFVAE